jgi:hypothetical protein
MMRSARNQDMITQQNGIEGVPPVPSAAETSGTRGTAARSETRNRTLLAGEVDRMRYFRDLLRAGRGAALHPGSGGETLRRDRIALRIPLPELDAVPLWSVRRADGMISIPFIEYIIGQVLASAQRIGRAAGLEEGEDALVEVRSLRRALVQVNSGGPEALLLPRLNDVYLPAVLVERLCGAGGILERMVSRAEALAGLGETGGFTVV